MILKPLTPIMLGLFIGLGLSLFLAPQLNEGCGVEEMEQVDKLGMNRKPNAADNGLKGNDDYNSYDDFEPRIRTQEKGKFAASQKTLLRPRYASTELGIREKLFVGVLTSKNTIDTFGTALNKTLTQYISKLVFFMNSRGPVLPTGLSVVIFSNEEKHMVPFHMFKYISDHYIKSFDWFYFITDNTYVRGDKLVDFVEKVSISNNFYIGKSYSNPSTGQVLCDIDGGILVSQVQKQ